ncbi:MULTISPECIES: hypothetical protein [Vagococcus]|uniref:hypothetical protein n=1 Tax=Vagococcus TaxID=2737 RepID=UPI00211B7066|nr:MULTISPECIES: hypothetical protein [Vagococcus]
MDNQIAIEKTNERKSLPVKKSAKKKFKAVSPTDVLQSAWIVRTFDEDRFLKVSLNGLFVQIGNYSNFRTIDELYPEIRTVVDAKGLIISKRKNRNNQLAYCKDKGKFIPLPLNY